MPSEATDPSYVTMTLDMNSTSRNGTSIAEFYLQHAPMAVAIDRTITPIFYLIGIPCNPLCAFIWLERNVRRSNSSAIYLGALSISHTVFLILHIFIELNYAWGIRTFDGYVSCELFYTVYYCPQYLAPLLVLGFTVERYIAVCYPFVKEKYCTVSRAVITVVVLLVFCFLLSCVQAYLWTYDENYQMCNHRDFLQRTQFPSLWTWITELIIFGAAPLAALVFNILVIQEIRSITTRGPASVTMTGSGQNQASTVTLLCVSFYLICTWLPATLVYSLEREFPVDNLSSDPSSITWQRHLTYLTVRKCVEEVTLSNSACYFFIYYLTGKHFRSRFKKMVCPKRCFDQSESCTAVNGRSVSINQYIAVPCRADNGYSTCISTV